MQWLLSFDESLFRFLNREPHFSALDQTMVFLSDGRLWWGIFFVILISGVILRRWKVVKLCALCAIAIGITDTISYHVLKPWVGRIRPCHALKAIRVLDSCGSLYTFPSNHAANGMGVWFVVKDWVSRPARWLILFFVLLVGYTRIHLGVHYPGDVVGGFLLGAITSTILVFAVRKVFKLSL